MARAMKVFCMYCEAKMDAGISFCPSCTRPTDWASHEERIQYELSQWRSKRGETNGKAAGVHAPSPPPPRKRAATAQAPAGPTVTRVVGDLSVRHDAAPAKTQEANGRTSWFGRARKRAKVSAEDVLPRVAPQPAEAAAPAPQAPAASTPTDPAAASASRLPSATRAPIPQRAEPARRPQPSVAPRPAARLDAPKVAAAPRHPGAPAPATPPPAPLVPRQDASAAGDARSAEPADATPIARALGSTPSSSAGREPAARDIDASDAVSDASWSRLLSKGPTTRTPTSAEVPSVGDPSVNRQLGDALEEKPAEKKTTAKKPAAKKPAPKKAAAKKKTAKKAAAKKTAKKAVAKKPATRKAPAKKTPAASVGTVTAIPAPAPAPAAASAPAPEPAAVSDAPAYNGALDAELVRETLEVLRGLGKQMGSLNERISGIEARLAAEPKRRGFFRRS